VRIVREERVGLSIARNRGVLEAAGEIVAFLDDDVTVGQGWADAIAAPFSERRIVGAGGPVNGEWEAPRPPWLHDELLPALGLSLPRTGPGDYVRKQYPVGANMAFRKSLFAEIGGFCEQLGRVGSVLLSYEDVELCARAKSKGRLKYCPDARVAHWVSKERLTRGFVAERRAWDGRSLARWARIRGGTRAVAELVGWFILGVPRDATLLATVRLIRGADASFRYRCRLCKHLGYGRQLAREWSGGSHPATSPRWEQV
jgi:GT2 family glycosyltransferase